MTATYGAMTADCHVLFAPACFDQTTGVYPLVVRKVVSAVFIVVAKEVEGFPPESTVLTSG